MLGLIRQLAKYGIITFEVKYRQWRVGCLVRLAGKEPESFVRIYDDKLYFALQKLIPLAKKEYEHLKEQNRHQQQNFGFNYGSTNKRWKEIA